MVVMGEAPSRSNGKWENLPEVQAGEKDLVNHEVLKGKDRV